MGGTAKTLEEQPFLVLVTFP